MMTEAADNVDPVLELLKDILPCPCAGTNVPGTEVAIGVAGDAVRQTCRECGGKLFISRHEARVRNELKMSYDCGFKAGSEDFKVRTGVVEAFKVLEEHQRPVSLLHESELHPDFEYRTTVGPRKAWDGLPNLDEEGWEINDDIYPGGWKRFDYTEERYWRRKKVKLVESGTPTVDLDGQVNPRAPELIRYVGKATRQPDGTWCCLADVGGVFCLVEVRLTRELVLCSSGPARSQGRTEARIEHTEYQGEEASDL